MSIKTISTAALISICASFCNASTNYCVVPPPNPGMLPPYTNWAMAATNIQTVIDIALDGDTISVTNGHYYPTNQVNVNKGITLSSFSSNGIVDPTNTIIDANCKNAAPAASYRCMVINNTGAVVVGFTLTNGSCGSASSGGGCYMYSGLITNCIITGNCTTNNTGSGNGGGIYLLNANAVAANCQIIGNVVGTCQGGGIDCESGAVVKDCFIAWNSDTSYGAGVSVGKTCAVYNCTIVSNTGTLYSGGAVYFSSLNAVVSNCTIKNNIGRGLWMPNNGLDSGNLLTHCSIIGNTNNAQGAGLFMRQGMTARNCLIAYNKSVNAAGGNSGAGIAHDGNYTTYVESCTIVSNIAYDNYGGGIALFSGGPCIVSNSIVCSNSAAAGKDIDVSHVTGCTNYFYNSCCVTRPLPPAQGNINSDPVFVDFPAGNFRLSRNSPCINKGAIQGWMTNGVDLDGHHRIDVFSSLVDMGCYEFIFAGSIYNFR